MSLLVVYTPLSESASNVISVAVVAFSAMVCGVVSSKKATNKGYLKGAVSGALYIAVLYLLLMLITEAFGFTAHMLLLFVLGVVFGAVGGIIGINSAASQSRKK